MQPATSAPWFVAGISVLWCTLATKLTWSALESCDPALILPSGGMDSAAAACYAWPMDAPPFIKLHNLAANLPQLLHRHISNW
jgi:hypothetical protein